MKDLLISKETETRIKEGIEKYRKGDFSISFFDKSGNMINVNDVDIKFKKHDFEFGINLYMVDQFPKEDNWKNEVYKSKLSQLFNVVTLPFYWRINEPEEGLYRYSVDSIKILRSPPIDLCMDFCKKYNLRPRLHGLAYEHAFPSWLSKYRESEVKQRLENRMKMISERYKDEIELIEVTNEMHYEKGVTEYYSSPKYLVNCFKTARKYFPNNRLIINEAFPQVWPILGDDKIGVYYDDIKNALAEGAEIDEIQYQFHMFFQDTNEYHEKRAKFYDIGKLLKITDKYAEFGLPMGISEITIPSYENNELSEEEQALVLEVLYKAWFSHKAIHHITYWNLVDGTASISYGDMSAGENYHYGGLLRFDMSEKPAYKVLNKLINHEWTTNLKKQTSTDGILKFRGFYGEYDLVINGIAYQIHLTEKNKEVNLFIK